MIPTPHRFLFPNISFPPRVHAAIVLAMFAAGCSTAPVKPEVSRVFATRCMASEASARALWYTISASISDGTFGTAAEQALGARGELWDTEKHPTIITCCRIWVHSDVCSPAEIPVDLVQEFSPMLAEPEKVLIETALEAEMAAAVERQARKP